MSGLLIIHNTEFADSIKQGGKRAVQIKHENIGQLSLYTLMLLYELIVVLQSV